MSEDFSVDELLEKMSEAYEEAYKKAGHCNVLVIGKIGVGKSTLINTIFRSRLAETGVGYPVTQNIRRYTKSDCPITVYDTPGLELNTERLESVKRDVSELIDKQRLKEVKEHIHVIWYCINHKASRFEEVEKEWINNLTFKDVPIILVLTQTLTRKRSELQAFLDSQNLPVCQIIPVLAEPETIDDDYTVKAQGLEHLVKVTFELLPEVAQKAFLREQTKNIDLKASETFKYVTAYVAGSALVGFSPIPYTNSKPKKPILRNYILYHYKRLVEQDKPDQGEQEGKSRLSS